MVEITYQMVLSTLQTIALIVGIYYYIMVLRNQHRGRQAQLFMQIYNNYSTDEYITSMADSHRMEYRDYDDFQEKYPSAPQRTPYTKQCFVMDGIGVLVEEGLIDIRLVAKLMFGDISWHWQRFGPYILENRERNNHPEYMYYSEYLYNEIVKARPDHSQIDITSQRPGRKLPELKP
jgi:hypothetical protein